MDRIEVSVICITYNQAEYIRDAVEGFLMQKTSFRYEILIHDDVSTDGTREILMEYQERYPDKIRLILEKENQYSKGVDILKEICLPQAKGKYIACCEGDDYWVYYGKLQAQYDLMESHPDVSLCYHNALVYEENAIDREELTLQIYTHKTGYVRDSDVVYPTKGWYPTASIMCRTEYMMDYYDMHAPTGDEGIRCYMACRGRLYYINQAWCTYRKQSKGSWNAKFEHDEAVARKYVCDSIAFLEEFNRYSNKKFEKYFYERLQRCVLWYIFAHDNQRSPWYTLKQFKSYIDKMKIATEHAADEMMNRIYAVEAIRCVDYYQDTIKKTFPDGFAGELYLYGAGIEATKAVAVLFSANIEIRGIVVTDKKQNKKRVFQYPIYGIDEMEPNENIVIWPCMFLGRESVISLLRERGFQNIII